MLVYIQSTRTRCWLCRSFRTSSEASVTNTFDRLNVRQGIKRDTEVSNGLSLRLTDMSKPVVVHPMVRIGNGVPCRPSTGKYLGCQFKIATRHLHTQSDVVCAYPSGDSKNHSKINLPGSRSRTGAKARGLRPPYVRRYQGR